MGEKNHKYESIINIRALHISQSFTSLTVLSKMSCPVNTFNKSKEDFIWFVKKAVNDKKSHSHAEMYHSLLKLFVDADTNKDGLVSKASFSKLMDMPLLTPICTKLKRRRMLPGRRCSTRWILRQ